jgi:hypothetical protein
MSWKSLQQAWVVAMRWLDRHRYGETNGCIFATQQHVKYTRNVRENIDIT